MINAWRLEMIFNVTIDRDEDGVWVVECPAIPGCVSQGATKEEALENVKEAIALCLEVRAEQGTLRSLIRSANLVVDEFVAAI
jgi:predicted RNase H-like HicB family nuclease